jgi:GT2 family glycosyltransferase
LPPLVTVGLPVFNGACFLAAALESVLRQTLQDFELIVVDDASADDSAAIAARFAGPRVRVERNAARLGIAGNWNRCAELATGKYLSIFHQDDLMAPRNLEAKVAVLERNPRAALAFSAVAQIDAAGVEPPRKWEGFEASEADYEAHGADFFRRLMLGKSNPVCCPSVVLRRECLTRAGRFDARLPLTLDLEMWLRLALDGDVVYLAEPLVQYRYHDRQASGGYSTLAIIRQEYAAKRQALRAAPAGLRAELAPALRRTYANRCLLNARWAAERGERAAARNFIAAMLRIRPASVFSSDAWRLLCPLRRDRANSIPAKTADRRT